MKKSDHIMIEVLRGDFLYGCLVDASNSANETPASIAQKWMTKQATKELVANSTDD